MEMTAREKDLLDELELLRKLHENNQHTMTTSIQALKWWVQKYEYLTGTNVLSQMTKQIYTTGEVLDYIKQLINNEEYTPEEKVEKLKTVSYKVNTEANWYAFHKMFFPMDYHDITSLIHEIKEIINAEWFRKTIKIKEKELNGKENF